jgi:hypothetical protein
VIAKFSAPWIGLGDAPGEDQEMAREASEETGETEQGRQRTPLTMIAPAAVLVLAAIGIVFAPHLGPTVEAGALRFQDQTAYNATVLSGARVAHPAGIFPAEHAGITVADVVTGVGSAAGALVLAFLVLYWRRLPALRRRSARSLFRTARGAYRGLRAVAASPRRARRQAVGGWDRPRAGGSRRRCS